MRPDFDKLLCERPRHGRFNVSKTRANNPKNFESRPSFEGIKKAHDNRKELNENLAPLIRYVDKQVGRKWDTVYSEIRQMMGKNPNAVKGHILQHLFWYVEIHTFAIGKQRFVNRTEYGSSDYRELSNGDNYVDDYGILRKYKRAVKSRKSWKQLRMEEWMMTNRNLSDGNRANKINGVWYLISFAPIEERHIHRDSYTIRDWRTNRETIKVSERVFALDVLGYSGSPDDFENHYGRRVYAKSKKAMSHNELKKYGLQND